MIRSILASVALALIAVHVVAGEDDLETQIKALQKERLETLTRLVDIYTKQYKYGYVSGAVFADAQTALVNAQLDAALANVQLHANREMPDAVKTIVVDAHVKAADAVEVAAHKEYNSFVETETDFILWNLPSSYLAIRLARAENDEANIKDAQKGLIKDLTRLVEDYKKRYITGTARLETLVKSQAALLDARVEAAEKPEERAALLEEYSKNEAEVLQVAESKQKAAVCSARSLFLNTKIKMLREHGAKDDVAAQIKAAQKERVEALTELIKIDTELWKTKWANLATLSQAKADLVNAQTDAADTVEAKVRMLTEAVKEQAEVVQITEKRAEVGYWDTQADVDRERLHLLDFKIRLLRERGAKKADSGVKKADQ